MTWTFHCEKETTKMDGEAKVTPRGDSDIQVASQSIVVYPKHVIWNQSDFPFVLRVVNGSHYYIIPARKRAVLHFQDSASTHICQLARLFPEWQFSGRFSVAPGDKMAVKTSGPTDRSLVVSVSTLSAGAFLLTTLTTHEATPFVVIRNFCPFALRVAQAGDGTPTHEVPGFHSLDLVADEPLLGTDITVGFPSWRCTAMGAETVEETVRTKLGEAKKLRVLTLVPRKAECHAVANVVLRVGRRESVRSARLGDHVLLLYKKANLGRRVRGKHSTVTLALPLLGAVIAYQPLQLPPHLCRLVEAILPHLPILFDLKTLESALHRADPTISPDAAIRQFSTLHLLLPQAASPGHFSINRHMLWLHRTVALELDYGRIELVFASAEIAESWAKLLRFEASTALRVFPRNNWLGVSRTINDLRNVESRFVLEVSGSGSSVVPQHAGSHSNRFHGRLSGRFQ